MQSQVFIHVPALLSPELLAQVDQLLPQVAFVDGKSTASGAAKDVKNNLQVSREAHEAQPQLQQLLMQAIITNPLIQSTLMPVRILPPIVSKYDTGMHYGWHTDSPLMGEQFTIRADASITVFLSDPASYEGGELVIHTPTGYVPYKLQRGDAIVYPTTRLHGVNEVTSGSRVAGVTWMQLAVKNVEQRELLWQLRSVMDAMAGYRSNTSEHLMLQQVYSNLVRMWTEIA